MCRNLDKRGMCSAKLYYNFHFTVFVVKSDIYDRKKHINKTVYQGRFLEFSISVWQRDIWEGITYLKNFNVDLGKNDSYLVS